MEQVAPHAEARDDIDNLHRIGRDAIRPGRACVYVWLVPGGYLHVWLGLEAQAPPSDISIKIFDYLCFPADKLGVDHYLMDPQKYHENFVYLGLIMDG